MTENIKEIDLLQKNGNAINEDAKTSVQSEITMEPALGGAMLAIFLAQTSFQNFYLETACLVDLHLPKEICSWNGTGEIFRKAEIDSQTLVSQVNISRGFVAGLLSTIVLMFLGPWSDYSGRRKPLMLLALGGMAVTSANVLVMLSISRPTVTWVLYAVQIPMSIGGSFGLLLSAAFNYVGDICYASGRDVTSAMGRCRAATQACTVLGALCGPLLYQLLGFYGVFCIVFFLQALSFLYVWKYVTDVKVNKDNKVGIFNIRLPYEAAKCLFRQREGRRRCIIILMLFVSVLDTMVLSADVALSYMYFRNKFSWSDVIFGFFVAYKNVLNFVGTLVTLRILKGYLGMNDELLGIIGGLSLGVAMVTLVAAETTSVAFLSPLIGLLSQGSMVVQRPILNRQIEASEQGKIASIIGALGTSIQLGVVPAFNLLYTATAATCPDAYLSILIMAAAAQTVAFLAVDGFFRALERLAGPYYAVSTLPL